VLISKEITKIQPILYPSKDVPNQFVYSLHKKLASGIMRVDKFSSGLNLAYMDLKSTGLITLTDETTQGYFGVGFNLNGYSQVRLSTNGQVFSAKPGSSTHHIFPTPLIMEEDIGGHKVSIAIIFDKKTLMDFANEDEEPFLPFLEGLQRQVCVTSQEKMEKEMKRILHQVISCPYTGKTRTLFLEGKAMELLARKLEQIKKKDKSPHRQPRIKAIDIERIHYAAELLIHDPVNPPDLTKLAENIGMSRSKFFLNFKMVHGHSPLDHLRSHRLQAARQLLQQGRHNVTEAAFAVGYSNLSYFARIFVAEFGVPPHKVI